MLYTKVQIRRDTTTNWESNNSVLAQGEFGFDTTLNKIKIGDGITAWNSLDFIGNVEIIDGGTF